jgi:two-component system chemotaxis response regulator CheY
MSEDIRFRNADRLSGSVDERPVEALHSASTPVLVVEDLVMIARLLRNLLRRIGLENVDDAPSGRIALEKMRAKNYALVITDCNMPGMSGYELLREIRSDPRLEMTAVLMVTADPAVVRFVTETDVTQYLIKPFSGDMLTTKITGLLCRTPPIAP